MIALGAVAILSTAAVLCPSIPQQASLCVSRSAWLPLAYRLRMYFWKTQQRWDRLAADAEQYIRLLPRDPEGYAQRAQAEYHRRWWAQALLDCDRAIQLQSDHADARLLRGALLFRYGNLSSALEDLTRSLEARPRASVYKLRAKVGLRRWDLAAALADLDQAIRLDPRDEEPWINRSAIHILRREYDKALYDCDQVLRFNPRSGPAHANRGAALVKRGPLYWQEALADFDQAIALNPNDVESLANRAQLNSKWGKWDRVVADCDAVLRLKPDWKKYHALRLEAFLARGELAWARLELEALLQMTVVRDAGDYRERGRLYRLRAQVAEEELAESFPKGCGARKRPGSKAAEYIRKEQQAIEQDRRCALAAYSAAIRMEPHFVDGYCQRAKISLLLKEYDRALADATAALGRDPDSAEAYRLHLCACSQGARLKPSAGLFWKQTLVFLQAGEYLLAVQSGERTCRMVLHELCPEVVGGVRLVQEVARPAWMLSGACGCWWKSAGNGRGGD